MLFRTFLEPGLAYDGDWIFQEVVYLRQQDAMNAVRKYNGVALDNCPMKINYVSLGGAPAQASTYFQREQQPRAGGRVGGKYAISLSFASLTPSTSSFDF